MPSTLSIDKRNFVGFHTTEACSNMGLTIALNKRKIIEEYFLKIWEIIPNLKRALEVKIRDENFNEPEESKPRSVNEPLGGMREPEII